MKSKTNPFRADLVYEPEVEVDEISEEFVDVNQIFQF